MLVNPCSAFTSFTKVWPCAGVSEDLASFCYCLFEPRMVGQVTDTQVACLEEPVRQRMYASSNSESGEASRGRKYAPRDRAALSLLFTRPGPSLWFITYLVASRGAAARNFIDTSPQL